MNKLRTNSLQPIEILLVEDNPGDARLVLEGFKDAKVKNQITVIEDGVEALLYLRRKDPYLKVAFPDLILLDLNMPRKNGCEVLAEIKADKELKHIPVLVFTVSSAEKDILEAYNLQASAFITKPIDLDEFLKVINSLTEFWLTIVKLPKAVNGNFYVR